MASNSVRMLYVFRLAVTCLLAAVLCGCATQSTVQPGGGGATEQRMGPEQGGVAFRLTVSGVGISPFFSFWHEVIVKRTDGTPSGGRYAVGMSDLGAVGSATYFGFLPEGQYEVAEFSSSQCGMMCVGSRLTMKEPLRFSVERGKISYLGNVMYQRTGENSAVLLDSGSRNPESFRAWLRTYYPAHATIPIAEAANERSPGARDAAFRQAQDSAAGFLNPVVLGSGETLYTTLSGSIRSVQASGAISTINTGIGGRSNALVSLDDKTWLVGGDFGELKSTRDAGKTWEDVKAQIPFGAIRGLYKGAPNEVVVVVDDKTKLSVHAGSMETNRWREVLAREYKFDRWTGGIVIPMLVFDDRKSRLIVALPGSQSVLVDVSTYAVQALEFPGAIMGLGLSGDGVIRCRCKTGGFGVSNLESRDLGKTWARWTFAPEFAIPQFRDAKFGLTTSGFNIQATVDGGTAWKQVYQQDRQYWPFIFQPYALAYTFIGEDRIVATDGMYEVLVSENAGNSWRRLQSGVRRQ